MDLFTLYKRATVVGLCSVALIACSQLHVESSAPTSIDTTQAVKGQGWYCDALYVQTELESERLNVFTQGKTWVLNLVEGEEQVYRTVERPYSSFQLNEENAEFVLEGVRMPSCIQESALAFPLVANGNEPSWQIRLNAYDLTLRSLAGPQVGKTSYRYKEKTALRHRIEATTDEGQLELMLTRGYCSDTMTGMPYPFLAQVTFQGETYKGCAGSPQQMIGGVEWYIQEAQNTKINQELAYLKFLPEGRVVGHTSCNSFFGRYELSGEGIRFSQMGATQKLCQGDKMKIEQAIFSVLNQATHIQIDKVGALKLQSLEGSIHAISF